MGLANDRRHYYVTSSLIGWSHTQNDPGYPLECAMIPSAILYTKMYSISSMAKKLSVSTFPMGQLADVDVDINMTNSVQYRPVVMYVLSFPPIEKLLLVNKTNHTFLQSILYLLTLGDYSDMNYEGFLWVFFFGGGQNNFKITSALTHCGAAPTTSSFTIWYLASMDWAKATAKRDEDHLNFVIITYCQISNISRTMYGATYIKDLTVCYCAMVLPHIMACHINIPLLTCHTAVYLASPLQHH